MSALMRTSDILQSKGFVIAYAIDDRASFEDVDVIHRDVIQGNWSKYTHYRL